MQENLTAIIVDDELHGRENLNILLENYCPEIKVLGKAESVIIAKELVKKNNPDVIFLDINMPVLDGFDFLEDFDDRNFMIVFVSAHSEYGIKAVKSGAADYLLKPINIKELKQTVKKLLTLKNKNDKEKLYTENDKLIIPDSHGFNILIINDIIRLEAEGNYTKIFLKDNKSLTITKTLKDFEDSIINDNFFRIHKSHIVNIHLIKEYKNIDGGFITMIDGSKIEISRRKAPDFIKKIKSVIKTV